MTVIFVIGFLNSGFAQEKRFEGQIYSGSNLGPLSNAHVKMGRYSARTNYEGRFSIRFTKDQPLVLSHSSHNTQRVPFENIFIEGEPTFYLTPTSNMTSTVIQGSEIQSVYENESEHVFDYTFLNDTLIVLSYMIIGKPHSPDKAPYSNCKYTALKYGEEIDRKIIPDNIYRLFNHPNGGLFLEAKDTSYTLVRTPEKLSITGFDFEDYKNSVSLDYAATPNAVFYAYQYPFIPMVAHKMYDRSTDETYLLRMVENRKYSQKVSDDLAMLTTEEITIAKELEEKTGINYQMFSTYIRGAYLYRDLTRPYAPGFMVDNEIIIFDHINNLALYYDSQGMFIRSTGLYHNNLTREKLVKMIQDPFTENLYTLHDKGGVFYIRKVDSRTGAAGQPIKLQHPFAEKVKVFENYVYYLYKSPIDEKVKHLVRERLPFVSDQNSVNNFIFPDK